MMTGHPAYTKRWLPVAEVIINGWTPGLQKITMTKLIHQNTSLGLKGAKSCTDRVLDGERVALAVDNDQQAVRLVEQLSAIGAVAVTHSQPISETRRLSVLMPVYNEEDTVARIIGEVLALPLDLELVVVDDGSTDETRARLRALEGAHDPHLKIVYAPQNAGKGAAIRAALAHAKGDVVVIQDADCEYDPHDFGAMLRQIEAGAAVVYGTRLSPEAARRLYGEGARRAFGAEAAEVGGVVLVAADLDDRVVLDVQLHTAAHAAIGADRFDYR